ncbi:helix-turn-helix transcriptional regulator (plasmid) [Rhizobium sp. WL3]|uniref:helix-turn-helix transcriptional regulator n=1 Tax=Rhizobium sp. WL3 TaxID=2603277 RepID=UPI0011C1F2D6|nr:AraC family transcriptional regulator [Rhizobium sp. WL3]QEE43193.1 helix-turn-helix transcriptional regulator [Rhizobium sp. WL3]
MTTPEAQLQKDKGPFVYKAMLEEPGSKAILQTTDTLAPQYSGMSFVNFYYPPGEYTGKSFNCWLVGIVRTPHESRTCEFGNKGTRARKISVGEILVIEPGVEYSSKISTRGQVDFLMLTEDRLNSALWAQHHDALGGAACGEAYFNSSIIAPLLHAVLSSANRPDCFDPHHADNYINAIVSGLCVPNVDQNGDRASFHNGLSPRDLRMLDEYIDNASGSPITNAQLASLVNLPEAVFLKAFKVSTEETPYQYVLQRRILRAKSLLGMKDLSIAEIAYSCGFSSQSHMTDVFRCRVGATPASVRKSAL